MNNNGICYNFNNKLEWKTPRRSVIHINYPGFLLLLLFCVFFFTTLLSLLTCRPLRNVCIRLWIWEKVYSVTSDTTSYTISYTGRTLKSFNRPVTPKDILDRSKGSQWQRLCTSGLQTLTMCFFNCSKLFFRVTSPVSSEQ